MVRPQLLILIRWGVSAMYSNFRSSTFALVILILSLSYGTSYGQWPSDSSVNLPIGDGDGDQVVPHLAINDDSSCYTGWYDTKNGNYDVALQLLDSAGTEMWPHGGITVSAHPQNSWVMDWALISDSDGNAIVAFADIRGGQPNIHVYKIDSDGNFLWGADGIDITSNNDDKGPPSLVETNDGDIVVAWFANSMFGYPAIRFQRLTADGIPQYGTNGIVASQVADANPTGQKMVPSGEDGFILAYVPVYSFMDNRQIKAQKFNAAGASVWADYLMIMDDGTVPMGHYFEMMSDGSDGAFFCWSVASGMGFNARAQHVDADGNESFVHNGQTVSTETMYAQISPDMAYNPATGDLTVLFIQMNGTQSEKGVFGQRLSAVGAMLWGATGLEILPVNTSNEGFVRVLDTGDGVIGGCFQAPQNAYGQDQIISFKLDYDGDFVWDPSIVGVSTAPTSKDDLLAAIGSDGTARFIWVDNRNGTGDTFGQNLNGDGSLGLSTVPVVETFPSLVQLDQNHPNPFNPTTDIVFSLPERQHVVLQIYDARGRVIRTLLDAEAGPGEGTVRWDGRGDTGYQVPSGLYFYILESGDSRQARKMTLVK
jgi:hypothetical protein